MRGVTSNAGVGRRLEETCLLTVHFVLGMTERGTSKKFVDRSRDSRLVTGDSCGSFRFALPLAYRLHWWEISGTFSLDYCSSMKCVLSTALCNERNRAGW